MLCGGDSPKPCGGDGSASWIPPMSLAGRVPRLPLDRPRSRSLPSPSLLACLPHLPHFPPLAGDRMGGGTGGRTVGCRLGCLGRRERGGDLVCLARA